MYCDNNHLNMLRCVATESDIPDFVKKADVSEITVHPDLPKEAFCIPSQRLYPVHNKVNTWLSSRHFVKAGHELPEPTRSITETRLKSACQMFGIEWPAPVQEKKAERSDTDFALLMEHNNKTRRYYPVFNKESAEQSIQKFGKEYTLYPPDVRILAAQNLEKKAREYGIQLDENSPVLKYTEQNVCLKTASDAINVRSAMTKGEYPSLYNSLLKKVAAAEESPGVLVEAIDAVDRVTGLARYWDTRIPDPYLSVFKKADEQKEVKHQGITVKRIDIPSCNEKTAQDTITLADRNISVDRLASMPLDWYEEILGDDIAKEIADGDSIDIESMKIILKSLPRSTQMLLVNNLPTA